MPGGCLDAYYMQCDPDVGGTDLWQSSFYDGDDQWWVGFHTLKPFDEFHLSQEHDWSLIGWQLWHYNGEGSLQEAYYNHPKGCHDIGKAKVYLISVEGQGLRKAG